MSKRLITHRTTESDVDWWLIIKLSMGDYLYLYYDSDMHEHQFMQGKFLRSRYSAFGQALKTIEDDAIDYIVV
ncbi:hypothetical protein DFA_03265 [Cavenderia fasciculata]|uniref:Uncharacterized protein n=1 Tax=Cavenderia fasciculata TaxID=261658 RepID=F4PH35_CACFS|nr:uncharacterized protein DFA_03265 [Cavenderia fasciculata]EGG25019.1 hypothetical protein DFA_03265 [Cavenderia fasciculata]|eukprot:XP_004362870.1 hypothetical protein DFA_03265 [Cavenderia fasciculata]